MKDKGSVLSILGLAILLLIICGITLSMMSSFQATQTAGCFWENDSVHNCSLTQNNYLAMNETVKQSTAVVGILSSESMIVAGVGVVVVIVALFAANR